MRSHKAMVQLYLCPPVLIEVGVLKGHSSGTTLLFEVSCLTLFFHLYITFSFLAITIWITLFLNTTLHQFIPSPYLYTHIDTHTFTHVKKNTTETWKGFVWGLLFCLGIECYTLWIAGLFFFKGEEERLVWIINNFNKIMYVTIIP